MKVFSETAKSIISILNEEGFHRGEGLAHALGITRNAIWKQISQLRELGLEIGSDKQKGYQLKTPYIPLSSDAIHENLDKKMIEKDIDWHVFLNIPSTNRFLKSRTPRQMTWDVCLAESQTQGRGRFNRDWYSPFGKNIYCSVNWIFKGDTSELSGLSLVIGLILLKALENYGIERNKLSIKWPNDIYYEDKKIAGILIELSAESHHQTQVVIGIGLNVNMKEACLSKRWTSLSIETEQYHNRNELLSYLLNGIFNFLNNYTREKKHVYLKAWQDYDFLFSKTVSVNRHDNSIDGVAKGINEEGDLIIQLINGEVTTCSSGEASLQRETDCSSGEASLQRETE